MYKTVRHGENSLQYKILAQQEEGMPGVKRRKSPKAVIVKLVAIIMLLIVGIVASAFLVPLLLANDFIAVTGTFQKFSVSTLRRSHSGNHLVVIAKKPYGWNAPHPTTLPRLTDVSQSPVSDAEVSLRAPHRAPTVKANTMPKLPEDGDKFPMKVIPQLFQKSPPATEPPHTTNESTGMIPAAAASRTTAEITATTRTAAGTTATSRATAGATATTRTAAETATDSLRKGPVPVQFQKYKLTTNPAPERTTGSSESNWGWVKFPPTNAIIRQQQSFQKETEEDELVSSRLGPVWYKPDKKWQFNSSNKADEEFFHFLYLAAGFVIVAAVMCFIAGKIACRRRTLPEKETEDKAKLLKPSVSSDHDEE